LRRGPCHCDDALVSFDPPRLAFAVAQDRAAANLPAADRNHLMKEKAYAKTNYSYRFGLIMEAPESTAPQSTRLDTRQSLFMKGDISITFVMGKGTKKNDSSAQIRNMRFRAGTTKSCEFSWAELWRLALRGGVGTFPVQYAHDDLGEVAKFYRAIREPESILEWT